MPKLPLIFILASVLCCHPGNAQTIETLNGKSIPFAEVDAFIKTQMDSLGLPGLSLAIINDSKIVYYRALGVTRIDTKEPVSEKTLFDAGSMSKTPFAFLVMKMVEKGVLDLDQPLYTYLPYPDIAHDDRYKLITARMVLCHTSGFPNWRFLNKDGKLDIKFTPGTKFSYSGEGFEYLANVVAHLKGVQKNGLQRLFEEEVSIPLGMTDASYIWSDDVARRQATGHVQGQVAKGYGINAQNPNFYAAYSLQTEARSYARFLIAMIRGESLKKATFDEMLKVHVETPSPTDTVSWGLGIKVKHSDSGLVYMHDGSNLNFTSSFLFQKEKKFGYVFFTNCDKGSEFNERLEPYLTSGK